MSFDIDSCESAHGRMSRRDAARLLAQGAAGLILTRTALAAEEKQTVGKLTQLQRAIPSSGEKLPVIGLGTWQAFDVSSSPAEWQPLEEVLALFKTRHLEDNMQGGVGKLPNARLRQRMADVVGKL